MTTPDHVHVEFHRPRRGARRRPVSARSWAALLGSGVAVFGGAVGLDAFALAGWTVTELTGWMLTYGTLATLLVLVWCKLAKMQEEAERAEARRPVVGNPIEAVRAAGNTLRGVTYAAAYQATRDAITDKRGSGSGDRPRTIGKVAA